MTPTAFRIACAPALSCLLLTSTLSLADLADEPQADLPDRAWEELVVVANHLPRPAREVGSAVTVLDAEDIRRREIDLGAELLREVPGLAVNRSGQVGNLTQVRIRGAEGNHTLVLIDGIEANDPGFGSEFNFADLLTFDLARIEVLRGPQSALYGSDAIGGVISLQTPDPEPGLRARGEVQSGSFGTRQLGASLGGGVERVAARLSAIDYRTDGISASVIQPERDGYQTRTVHGKVDGRLGEHVSARLVLRQSDNEVESDRQDFDFPATPTQGLIVDADEVIESRQRYGLLAVDAEALDGRWLHHAAFGWTDTVTENFATGLRTGGNRAERRKLEYRTSLRLNHGAWNQTITGGVQRELLEFEGPLGSPSPDLPTRRDDQTSLVAEYALAHGRHAAASLSLRHDDNDRFDDATTWRATGSWLFESTNTRLHGSYGEGVTDPSFVELFGFVPSSFLGNPDLRPETSESFDAGIEQALLDGRALVDVTLFRSTLSDEIVTVLAPGGTRFTVVNQRGDSDREGVEVALEAELGGGWSLAGAFTWLDATDPDGLREIRRPRRSGSVNVNYGFHGGRGNVNLGAVFNGEQQDSEFVFTTAGSRVTLDEYTLVNAAASYDVSQRLQLFVRGENLLDEDYTEVFGYRSPGIAGYLGLRVRL